jgi:hypothetical protein
MIVLSRGSSQLVTILHMLSPYHEMYVDRSRTLFDPI